MRLQTARFCDARKSSPKRTPLNSRRIRCAAENEGAIELDRVDRIELQIAQRIVPGSEIVEGDGYAATVQPGQYVERLRLVA